MFVILIGRFYYTSPIHAKIRDYSLGTFHSDIATHSGDGEEFYVVAVSADRAVLERILEKLDAREDLWRKEFEASTTFNPIAPERVREIIAGVLVA